MCIEMCSPVSMGRKLENGKGAGMAVGYKENDWEATDEKKKTDTIYQCRK